MDYPPPYNNPDSERRSLDQKLSSRTSGAVNNSATSKPQETSRSSADSNAAPAGAVATMSMTSPAQMVTNSATGEQTLLFHVTFAVPASNITSSASFPTSQSVAAAVIAETSAAAATDHQIRSSLGQNSINSGQVEPSEPRQSEAKSSRSLIISTNDQGSPVTAATLGDSSRLISPITITPTSKSIPAQASSSSITTAATHQPTTNNTTVAAAGPSKPVDSPDRYLEKLLSTVSPKELAKLISKGDDFHKSVLKCLISKYSFKQMPIDVAIRTLLYNFALPAESQQIDRVIQAFSMKYVTDNPDVFQEADQVHILAFAIVMLNSDLHNPAQRKKMTKESFVNNTYYALKKLRDSNSSASEVVAKQHHQQLTQEQKQQPQIVMSPTASIKSTNSTGTSTSIANSISLEQPSETESSTKEERRFLDNGIPFELLDIVYENILKEKLRYMEDVSDLSDIGWVIKPIPNMTKSSHKSSTENLTELFNIGTGSSGVVWTEEVVNILKISYMYPLLLSSSTGGLVNSDDEDDDEESSISSRPHSRNPSAAPNLGPTSTGSVRGTDGGGLDTAFFGKSGPDVNNAPAASVSNNALAATSIAVSNAHHSRPESAISKLFSVDRTKAKHGLLEVFAKKVWEGKLKRKRLFIHGEPAPKSKRSWKTVWAVLSSGGQLLMFEDWVWFESKRDLPITDRIPIDNSPLPKQGTPIPINGTIALYDPTFVTIKKPRPPRNAFRLYDLHGTSFMFRGESIEDCKEWILRLNYVAAFKYCGIRFSGGGSSVAGSNTVVAGGSTTSSFNIIVNSTHSYNNTAQQHQKQQISPISLENKTTSNYSMSFPAASSMCTPSVLASPPNQTGGILSSSLIAPHQASLSLAAHHHGDGNTVESNPPRERRRSILDMFELRNHHHTHPSPQSPPSTTAPLHGSSDGEQGSSEGISPHLEAAREAAIEMKTQEMRNLLIQSEHHFSHLHHLLRHLTLIQPLSSKSKGRIDELRATKLRDLKRVKIDIERYKCYLQYLRDPAPGGIKSA